MRWITVHLPARIAGRVVFGAASVVTCDVSRQERPRGALRAATSRVGLPETCRIVPTMKKTAVLLVLASASVASADDLRDGVRTWRASHEAPVVRELAEFLAIPNLASDAEGIRRNAEHARRLLERR